MELVVDEIGDVLTALVKQIVHDFFLLETDDSVQKFDSTFYTWPNSLKLRKAVYSRFAVRTCAQWLEEIHSVVNIFDKGFIVVWRMRARAILVAHIGIVGLFEAEPS